ncbi:hypothetical protein Q1695_012590 [Nippostrongylus brasiliensis]|nr:hypothetical protein Q1695_012590 [Nippostrongylus brasiliensis]
MPAMQSMSDAVVDFSEVNDVVAELNESDAVPDGVKSIFTKLMKVFVNKMSSVFAENAMLRQENRKLKEEIDNYERKRRSTPFKRRLRQNQPLWCPSPTPTTKNSKEDVPLC